MIKSDRQKLVKIAINASKNSYSPYSKYRVGAAVLCESGKIFTGCNIENASYGATICAERSAVAKAISEGEKKLIAIAIYGSSYFSEPNYAFPCGICRQVLNEFAKPDMLVIIARSENDYQERTLEELLPDSFGSANLDK